MKKEPPDALFEMCGMPTDKHKRDRGEKKKKKGKDRPMTMARGGVDGAGHTPAEHEGEQKPPVLSATSTKRRWASRAIFS